MPLWRIYHPESFFSASEKNELAQSITQLYTHLLPAFYVDVLFIPVAHTDMYVGGIQKNNFVRLAIEHIARNFDGDKERMAGMMKRINAAVGPTFKAKNADWEAHIAETRFELWSINGTQPPLPGSEQEKLWKKENKPVRG